MSLYQPYLVVAERAARKAGAHLRAAFHDAHSRTVDEELEHDIKLRLDKETQALITAELLAAFPESAILGEEGDSGKRESTHLWIVDPLDGTVNFYYGIPIFCVSIALQVNGKLVLGCVYDPMQDECYTAIAGEFSCCNNRPITVSARTRMEQAAVFVGHGRHDGSGEAGIRRFAHVSARVRKMRILGSAAISLCYIAAGRLDAYVEGLISLWDFAAAKVILETAGGKLDFSPRDAEGIKGAIVAWNGLIPICDVLQSVE